jgi:hypothetical protein
VFTRSVTSLVTMLSLLLVALLVYNDKAFRNNTFLTNVLKVDGSKYDSITIIKGQFPKSYLLRNLDIFMGRILTF